MTVRKLHPVGVLIEAVKAVEEWSDTDLVRRAEDAGYRISKSRISQMRTEPVRSVSPDNIAALTAALGVPTERVVRAYLEAMGFPLVEPSRFGVEEAIRADGRLSSDDKDSLLALLRVMRGRHGRKSIGGAGGGESESRDVPERRGAIRGKLGAGEGPGGDVQDPEELEDLAAGERNGEGL